MGLLNEYFQRMKPITPTRPFLDVELAVNEEAYWKRIKYTQYSPDKLLTKKKIEVYNDLINDAEIESSINALKTIRLSSGWEVVPASDIPIHKQQSDFVIYNFENIEGSFDDDLREMMGAVEMGVSINELVWAVQEQGLYKNKIILSSLKSKNPKYLNVWVDDFDNIREDGIVNISGIDYGRKYPAEKFVIYSFNKKYENVLGTSRLRAIYDLWFLKQIIIKSWAIFIEKYGHPIPIIKHPGLDSQAKANLLTALKQFRVETGLLIPKAVELDFADVKINSTDLYIKSLEHINEQIRKTILGQTLTSDAGSKGSYGLGQVHFDILLMYEQHLGEDLSKKAINNQIIKRLIDYNFGKQEEYPKFRFKPLVQDDVTVMIDKYYTGVQMGAIKPIPEDEDKIRELLHLPKRDESKSPAQVTIAQQTEKYADNIIAFKEKLFTGTRRKTLTPYEKHTDYSDIKDILESNTEDFSVKIGKIMMESVDDIKGQIDRKKIIQDKNIKAIENLHLKYVGDMKIRFQEMLESLYKLGMRDARKEILAKKKVKTYQEIDWRKVTPTEALNILYNNKAFYVTGIERDFILKKVKDILYRGIETGASVKDIMKGLDDALQPYFDTGLVDDEVYSGARLETITRTNISSAYNQGRKAYFEDPTLEGFTQAYQYSAILDDRVRPNHAKMDSRIYAVTNPIWDTWTPPNGFNCRCLLIPVTADEEWEESPVIDVQPDAGFEKPGTKGS